MTGASGGNDCPVRLLCLGNELLGDDGLGIRVAREARARFGESAEVVCSPLGGLHLIDEVVNAGRLIVIDSIQTGKARPGTIFVVDGRGAPDCGSATSHGAGLFDILAQARQVGMPVPAQCIVVAVEAADCVTVGGAMHPDVEAAIPVVLDYVSSLLEGAGSSL